MTSRDDRRGFLVRSILSAAGLFSVRKVIFGLTDASAAEGAAGEGKSSVSAPSADFSGQAAAPPGTVNGGCESVLGFGADPTGQRDSTDAIQSAVQKSTSGEVFLPRGRYRIDKGGIRLANVALRGAMIYESGPPYDNDGTVLEIFSRDRPAFLLGDSVTLAGLNFFYPDQDGKDGKIIKYAPTIEGERVSRVLFDYCSWINAYDAIRISSSKARAAAGNVMLRSCKCFAIHRCIELAQVPEVVQVSDSFFSIGNYEGVVTGKTATGAVLRQAVQTEGEWIRIDAGSRSGKISGLMVSNSHVYGYRYGLRVVSGFLNVSSVTNTNFDGVATAISVDREARIGNTRITGCLFYSYRCDNRKSPDAVIEFLNEEPSVFMVLANNNFSHSGDTFLKFTAGGLQSASITGNVFSSWNVGQTPGSSPAIVLDSSETSVLVTSNYFRSHKKGDCAIEVRKVRSALINGNVFEGSTCSIKPVDFRGVVSNGNLTVPQ